MGTMRTMEKEKNQVMTVMAETKRERRMLPYSCRM
jgi:hypothetical protein